MTDLIEGTADEMSTELDPRHDLVPVGAPALAVTPTVQAGDLVQRLDVIREAQQKAMVADVDYGVIPGTDKPTLLKPGAEKLGVLFQLDVQLSNEKTWGPGDHLTVESKATVYHAPSGARLGFGEGVCTTRERKYAKRKQERTCPECGMGAVIKGKAEYGGGWLCFKKKGGCGQKWSEGAPTIESQTVGEIENPDLPDLWNTVVKMAEKRARVDAVLAVTGASALFTQDAEDFTPAAGSESSPKPVVGTPASDQQKTRIRKDFKRMGLTKGMVRAVLAQAGVSSVEDVDSALDNLFKHQASAVIDRLGQGAIVDPEQAADVDSDATEFEHPPVSADDFKAAFEATEVEA